MNQAQIQQTSFELIAELFKKKFISKDHPLVHDYIESQEVRNCVRRFGQSFGVNIVREGKHIHLLVQPRQSMLTNPIQELKKSVKTYRNRIDLYLMGVVWMILCSEADHEVDTKIKWENEGLAYGEIEELVTKALSHWYEQDKESEGAFSEEWSLAVHDMYEKWRLLKYNKVENGRVSYIKDSKFGIIDSAVKELEKDKMVFVDQTAQTKRVTPTPVFFERLKARFGNKDMYQDRYDAFQILLEDARESSKDLDEQGEVK